MRPTLFLLIGILTPFFRFEALALSLDASIQTSLGNSSLVKGQEKMASLASGDRWRRFLIKEPQFTYTNSDTSNEESWGVALATPFPGKSIAYTELDRAKAKNEAAEIKAKKQDVAKQITDAYLECASTRDLHEIQKVTIYDLETIWHSLTAMYESGHASQAERIGAELQVRQTKSELAIITDKIESACMKWRRLLGKEDPSLVPDGIPDDLSAETINELGSYSAEESRSEAAIELARVNDDLRWWAQAPDLNWSYARNHYLSLPGSPTGKQWTTTLGVSITIPLFFFFSESIEAKRAQAQARMDRQTAQVQLLNAQNDRVSAGNEFRRVTNRLKELKEKDLALAEALVQSTLAAYKIGKLGFAELLMSRKTLAELRAQVVQVRVAKIQARLRCLDQCEKQN